jgi:hypothetical protein
LDGTNNFRNSKVARISSPPELELYEQVLYR